MDHVPIFQHGLNHLSFAIFTLMVGFSKMTRLPNPNNHRLLHSLHIVINIKAKCHFRYLPTCCKVPTPLGSGS